MAAARWTSWRWVKLAAVLLLVGAGVSYAVACAAAIWSPLGVVTGAGRDPRASEGTVLAMLREMSVREEPKAEGRLDRLSRAAAPLFNGVYSEHEVGLLSQQMYMQRGVGLEYETLVMGPLALGTPQASVYGVRAGWPLRCVSTYRFSVVSGNSRSIVDPYWVGAVDLPKWARKRTGAWNLPRQMPVSPLWTGLVVNSLLYACVVGAPVWFVGVLLRRSRARRGLCVDCGYRLTGLLGGPCPECGRAAHSPSPIGAPR